jgi:hypothetical protein
MIALEDQHYHCVTTRKRFLNRESIPQKTKKTSFTRKNPENLARHTFQRFLIEKPAFHVRLYTAMANPKKNTRVTIEEYNKAREQKRKQRFRIELYPWPVMTVLGVPLVMFICLLLVYFLHLMDITK